MSDKASEKYEWYEFSQAILRGDETVASFAPTDYAERDAETGTDRTMKRGIGMALAEVLNLLAGRAAS